jgi:hypothetical protein
MPAQPRKMSEILKEMAESLLRHPDKVLSSAAMHVALCFANAAWNEGAAINGARETYRNVWETIELENPELWNEFKSNDINAMIDDLVQYKKNHYPDDQRRILTCGIPDGKIRVESLKPAAPGVDPRWEMRLYGLVRVGEREKAIGFLQGEKVSGTKYRPEDPKGRDHIARGVSPERQERGRPVDRPDSQTHAQPQRRVLDRTRPRHRLRNQPPREH